MGKLSLYLPFFGFMLAGWYGLSQVLQSKRDLRVSGRARPDLLRHCCCVACRLLHARHTAARTPPRVQNATKGLEPVEELDPVERMRRRYGLGEGGEGAAGGLSASAPIRSVEEELEATLKQINIKDFDYKPVPRQPEEQEQ